MRLSLLSILGLLMTSTPVFSQLELQTSLNDLKVENSQKQNGFSAIAVRFGKLQLPIAWDGVLGQDWGHTVITMDASDGQSLWDYYWVKSGKITVTSGNLSNDLVIGGAYFTARNPQNPNAWTITIVPSRGVLPRTLEYVAGGYKELRRKQENDASLVGHGKSAVSGVRITDPPSSYYSVDGQSLEDSPNRKQVYFTDLHRIYQRRKGPAFISNTKPQFLRVCDAYNVDKIPIWDWAHWHWVTLLL
ncbi:hypothetical protein GALMADRAFT_209929 [Galerina marginata CBS 339.88]|uniref:Uncharacterized protein n=1 Tax=Galerina marginata (strain CBS 339.88) TaxID=685588 RepID=A0A067TCM2_GALM3|nr:hypothetical protein GALMADRAFT_209929 [Galerina marginata CBS 339.88]